MKSRFASAFSSAWKKGLLLLDISNGGFLSPISFCRWLIRFLPSSALTYFFRSAMTETVNGYRIFSPDQPVRSHELKQRRRSISISLHETATPAVKSLLSSESHDLSLTNFSLLSTENADLQSAYDKLTVWKRTMEKQLNRSYLLKLKEIDHLLAEGRSHIDILFNTMPSFEQLAIITCRQPIVDRSYDEIQFDYDQSQSFDLTSNNILLCSSDHQALIFDDVKSKLIVYSPHAQVTSFSWDSNEHGEPYDLTYSSYLDLFCVITNRGLLTWSPEHQPLPSHIDSIKSIAGNRLWSLASTGERSDVFVLFKLGSYVERWNSALGTKSWQHIQRWSNHDLFERNDQRIRTIRMTSTHVAWTVESTKTAEWRVDLLDYRLQIIRSGIQIEHLDKSSSCLLSNFGPTQFLIIDSNRHLLFLLDSEGLAQPKTDQVTAKRLRNAVLMKQTDQSWLVVRLEQPNQLHFMAISNQTDNWQKQAIWIRCDTTNCPKSHRTVMFYAWFFFFFFDVSVQLDFIGRSVRSWSVEKRKEQICLPLFNGKRPLQSCSGQDLLRGRQRCGKALLFANIKAQLISQCEGISLILRKISPRLFSTGKLYRGYPSDRCTARSIKVHWFSAIDSRFVFASSKKRRRLVIFKPLLCPVL